MCNFRGWGICQKKSDSEIDKFLLTHNFLYNTRVASNWPQCPHTDLEIPLQITYFSKLILLHKYFSPLNPSLSFWGLILGSCKYVHVRSSGLLTKNLGSPFNSLEVCMENPIQIDYLGGLLERHFSPCNELLFKGYCMRQGLISCLTIYPAPVMWAQLNYL